MIYCTEREFPDNSRASSFTARLSSPDDRLRHAVRPGASAIRRRIPTRLCRERDLRSQPDTYVHDERNLPFDTEGRLISQCRPECRPLDDLHIDRWHVHADCVKPTQQRMGDNDFVSGLGTGWHRRVTGNHRAVCLQTVPCGHLSHHRLDRSDGRISTGCRPTRQGSSALSRWRSTVLSWRGDVRDTVARPVSSCVWIPRSVSLLCSPRQRGFLGRHCYLRIAVLAFQGIESVVAVKGNPYPPFATTSDWHVTQSPPTRKW